MTPQLPLTHHAGRLADLAGKSRRATPLVNFICDGREHGETLLTVTQCVNDDVTLENVPSSNVADMDSQWTLCREPWERLTWARSLRFETPTDAARSLGMKPHTYAAYERPPGSPKWTPLKDQRAIEFAKKFGVDWVWLLKGDGSPFVQRFTPAQERVLNAMVGKSDEEQDRIAAALEMLLQSTGTGR